MHLMEYYYAYKSNYDKMNEQLTLDRQMVRNNIFDSAILSHFLTFAMLRAVTGI